MEEFLWTVDEYTDTLKKRPAAAVRKTQEKNSRYRVKTNVFGSELDAVMFMLARAQANIERKTKELKAAQARLKKIQKKHCRAS